MLMFIHKYSLLDDIRPKIQQFWTVFEVVRVSSTHFSTELHDYLTGIRSGE